MSDPAAFVADLRGCWRPALRFHVVMRLAGLAVAAPLLTLAFRAVLAASGDRVISNYDIAAYLLSPIGMFLAVAGAAIGVALLLAELAGLTHIANSRFSGRVATLGETLSFLAGRFPAVLMLAARLVLRIALIALPFAIVIGLAAFVWLREHDINYYLAEQPAEWVRMLRLVVVLAALAVLAIGWQLLRWFYALPALVSRPEATAKEALDQSQQLTRGAVARVLWPLLGWWSCVALVFGALLLVARYASLAAFNWAGMSLARVLPVVALGVALTIVVEVVLSGLAIAGQQCLAMRGYLRKTKGEATPAAHAVPAPAAGRLALRAVVGVTAIALVAAAASWLALSSLDLRPRVEVTAHRGASIMAPENTMAAFRAALDAGTGWIELDVQRTRDGRIAVLHDGDFMRMAGDPRRIGDVTAADLAGIDIGRRYNEKFTGEQAPLLEDVIALVRGRAKLNVELKYNVPDPALAPTVVEMLRRERFLDQSVITSLDYAALRQVEAIEPGAVTGHIVTAAVGNVLRTEANFLSLNAAQATVSLVRRAHRAGKGVHVWTVNTRDAMLELAARGVDNIITDDPALFAQVRAEADALEPQALLGLRLRAIAGRPPGELTDAAQVSPL